MRSQAEIVIDRPVGEVFKFWADDHVENHPRWDPDIQLWHDSGPPLAVGSTIRRRNTRSGEPVDGSMEIVRFERDKEVEFVIRDGPMEFRGGGSFADLGGSRSTITTWAEIPGMTDEMAGFITAAMERSVATIKRLVEEGK